ncbi:MAG TPA: SHOCT domain-containing protein [Lapillicoccus sp.]|uniref:SHOCT domain-containing protein n=1 Tax=Lapillicoccus sp. TaxID=1909287 RepID=UPI002F938E67
MDYPLLNLFLTMLYFFLWIAWLFLLFRIILDIFRSADLGGWGKAGWTILIVFVPFLGVLVYVIARGSSMQERDLQHARESRQAMDRYITETARGAAPSTSPVDELTKLADLHKSGAINDDEFAAMKAKVLA